MNNLLRNSVLAGVAIAIGLTAGAAWSQDGMKVVQDRQELMKRQGKDLAAVKAYLDDKGDVAAARPAAFPKDTGMAQFPGKSGAKPAIWVEWDKFTAAQQNALTKIVALNTALKGTDKPAVATAFGEVGKDGCGGCHTPFREKI
jgi:cytochrome c556